MTEGIKFDEGKVRMELLPPDALYEVALVLTLGAKKYSLRNWERGMDHGRLLGAALRHINAYEQGQALDPESGLEHLAHGACDLLMLLALRLRHVGKDDRSFAFVPEEGAMDEEQLREALHDSLEDAEDLSEAPL